jgi:hypothetical protein
MSKSPPKRFLFPFAITFTHASHDLAQREYLLRAFHQSADS